MDEYRRSQGDAVVKETRSTLPRRKRMTGDRNCNVHGLSDVRRKGKRKPTDVGLRLLRNHEVLIDRMSYAVVDVGRNKNSFIYGSADMKGRVNGNEHGEMAPE